MYDFKSALTDFEVAEHPVDIGKQHADGREYPLTSRGGWIIWAGRRGRQNFQGPPPSKLELYPQGRSR